MEEITEQQFNLFVIKVKKAQKLAGFPELHHYDLKQYCNTLINGASVFQLLGTMQCSDRIDLIDSDEESNNPTIDELAQKFKAFTMQYLGLKLKTQCDPRGAVFKLIVDPSLGDSIGDRSHLCVPCVDAYQSLN